MSGLISITKRNDKRESLEDEFGFSPRLEFLFFAANSYFHFLFMAFYIKFITSSNVVIIFRHSIIQFCGTIT